LTDKEDRQANLSGFFCGGWRTLAQLLSPAADYLRTRAFTGLKIIVAGANAALLRRNDDIMVRAD
jgi:hypothetical protein